MLPTYSQLAHLYSVAKAADDPIAFRSTLLIAALHYAWRYSNLEPFESTFIFHKVEGMRMINDALVEGPDPSTACLIIRQISALIFAEARDTPDPIEIALRQPIHDCQGRRPPVA